MAVRTKCVPRALRAQQRRLCRRETPGASAPAQRRYGGSMRVERAPSRRTAEVRSKARSPALAVPDFPNQSRLDLGRTTQSSEDRHRRTSNPPSRTLQVTRAAQVRAPGAVRGAVRDASRRTGAPARRIVHHLVPAQPRPHGAVPRAKRARVGPRHRDPCGGAPRAPSESPARVPRRGKSPGSRARSLLRFA